MATNCLVTTLKGVVGGSLPKLGELVTQIRGGNTQVRVLRKDRIKIYLGSTEQTGWGESGSLPGAWYMNITASGISPLSFDYFYDLETLNSYSGVNYLRISIDDFKRMVDYCPSLSVIGFYLNDTTEVTEIIKNKLTLTSIQLDNALFDLKPIVEAQYGQRSNSLVVKTTFSGKVYLNGNEMSSNDKTIDFSTSTVTIKENGTTVASYDGSTWVYN